MTMKHRGSFWFLPGIYGLWVALSWGAYGMFGLLPQSVVFHPVLSLVLFLASVLFFLLVGCQINAFYLAGVEPEFRRRPRLRYFSLFAVLLLCGVMYLAASSPWSIRHPVFFMFFTANLLVFANLLGAWIITPLKREAELIIVCIVMALADMFSFARGPTRHIAESIQSYYQAGMPGPPPVGDFLLVKIPVAGLGHLQPVFGVSDWIIVVFLSAAAARFKINDNVLGRGPLYFSLAAAGLAMAIFIATLMNRFIPALPVIAVLFAAFLLIRCPAARALNRSDWRLIVVFSGVMLALLGMFMMAA